jgi:hypothetical protein
MKQLVAGLKNRDLNDLTGQLKETADKIIENDRHRDNRSSEV